MLFFGIIFFIIFGIIAVEKPRLISDIIYLYVIEFDKKQKFNTYNNQFIIKEIIDFYIKGMSLYTTTLKEYNYCLAKKRILESSNTLYTPTLTNKYISHNKIKLEICSLLFNLDDHP